MDMCLAIAYLAHLHGLEPTTEKFRRRDNRREVACQKKCTAQEQIPPHPATLLAGHAIWCWSDKESGGSRVARSARRKFPSDRYARYAHHALPTKAFRLLFLLLVVPDQGQPRTMPDHLRS